MKLKRTRGNIISLGKEKTVKNNVLILEFDKYGVLITKKLINKENMNKLKFSEMETINSVSKVLLEVSCSSMRQKMYSNRGKND